MPLQHSIDTRFRHRKPCVIAQPARQLARTAIRFAAELSPGWPFLPPASADSTPFPVAAAGPPVRLRLRPDTAAASDSRSKAQAPAPLVVCFFSPGDRRTSSITSRFLLRLHSSVPSSVPEALILAFFQRHVGQAQIRDQLLQPLILLPQPLDFVAGALRAGVSPRKRPLPASMKSFSHL